MGRRRCRTPSGYADVFAEMVPSTPLGYGRVEDLVGRTVIDITHPDDRAGLAANVAALIAGQIHTGNLEKRNRRADGSAVCLKQSAALVRDDAGDPFYVFGHAVDITGERSLVDSWPTPPKSTSSPDSRTGP